jgi:murein DD-endopeptidase MepM/ murein hydrolase activator NlpD
MNNVFFNKNRLVLISFTSLFLSVSFLGGCSSSPSVIQQEDKDVSIDELEHFSNLDKKQLEQIAQNKENQGGGKTRATDFSEKTSATKEAKRLNDIEHQTQKAIQATEKFDVETFDDPKVVDFSIDEKTIEKNLAYDAEKTIEIKVETPNKIKKTSQKKLDLNKDTDVQAAKSTNEKINQVAQIHFNSKARLELDNKEKSSVNKKQCNELSGSFKHYNDLTRLTINCGWNLPLLLKMNNILNKKDFYSEMKIFFPPAIYHPSAQGLVGQTSTVNCLSDTAKISTLKEVEAIAKKCHWKSKELVQINDLNKKFALKNAQYTIVLPPAIPKLKSKHSAGQLKHSDLVIDNNIPKKITKIPQFCQEKSYTPKNNEQSIESISLKCKFNPLLMAVLNKFSAKQNIPAGKKIIMPAGLKRKIKRKKYKFPLDLKNCKKRVYKVEYGMSFGKIASTCQWNQKLLLRINQISSSAILQIGDEILFPASLKLKQKTQVKKVKPIKAVKTINYDILCNKKSYLFNVNDDLIKLSNTCNWDIDQLIAINAKSLSLVATQEQTILLPPLIDNFVKTDSSKTKLKKHKWNPIKERVVKVCTQKKIKKIANEKLEEQLKTLAKECHWNLSFLTRINQKSLQTVTPPHIVLPTALYTSFGKIATWTLPILKKDYKVISQNPEKPTLFYFTPKKDNTVVQNIQKGVLIFVHKTENNNYLAIVKHSEKYISIYDNLSSVNHKSGSVIEKGDSLGQMKNSSQILEYQLFKDNVPVSIIKI